MQLRVLRATVGVCSVVAAVTVLTAPAGAANGLLAFQVTGDVSQTIRTVDPVTRTPMQPAPSVAPLLGGPLSAAPLTVGPLAVPGVPVNQDAANPAWSPDGTRLAYSSTVGGATDIYVVNANAAANGEATTPLRITHDPVAAIDPTWSPDARQIAFTSFRGGDADIYVIDLATGAEQRLTTDPSADQQADWSPDGALIAFQSDRAGSEDIWLMARDGSGQRALTHEPGEESDADWKRDDGRRIAYSAGAPGADQREIYSIRAPIGGTSNQLTRSSAGRNAFPAWSPDGNEIAYVQDDRTLYVTPAQGATATAPARVVATGATDPDWAVLPLPMAKATGDVTVQGPGSKAAQPVSGGDVVKLTTGSVVDTSGGGELTLTVNRPATSASSPDSITTLQDAVVQVTERTPESLGLRIRRPEGCPASTATPAPVKAAAAKPKKARLTTRTVGKGKKKAALKPSTPEVHTGTPDTDYDVVVTCNGTYVHVRDGIVFVTPNGGRTLTVREGHEFFAPKAR